MKKSLALLAAIVCFAACKKEITPLELPVSSFIEPIEIPRVEFGFTFNDFDVVQDTIRKGDSFGQLLFNNNLSYSEIANITAAVKDSFDLRKLDLNPYTILKSKDSLNKPQVFIYQPNRIDYVVVDFRDTIVAQRKSKPVTIVKNTASGVINSTLSETIEEQGLSYNIANDLSSIYAWTIDFFKLQKGDRFKIVYTEKYIDDTTYVGIDQIKSSYFEHNNKPFYAFQFVADTINNIPDYFDEEAKTLRKAFLKAPLKFSTRISSRFTRRRFHPVQRRWKAHKGTDYAAQRGTPIISTANGTVTKSGYTRGNGNYVKIRHNATYSTQYLHMSKRKSKVGEFVKQGEVIGYVGSTGLASGPHVCYRFWKNGRQVDPYKQKLPEAKPMDPNMVPVYLEFIKNPKRELDNISFQETNL
ncbi:MAG: peptidoglycan DD-metalloendopeptidase family protein [Flavobacteriaceae bacterium]|nr:peptidoglycan DD-metalloendopeptidase family protein [Flavobacteriaceae bacterium]